MKTEKTAEKDAPDLQRIFTAYVQRAVRNRRYDYIRRQKKRLQWESLQEELWLELEANYPEEFEKALPLHMQLENNWLLLALKGLTVRERSVFLTRVLDEATFQMIAEKFGLSCAAAASAYYRAVRKLRQKMGEQDR